tara:strand:- start:746 stop:1363 length:618 start_codon:yes stop_codon:yes gene_type:complete
MAWSTEPTGLDTYSTIMEKVLEKAQGFNNIDQDQVERIMNLVAYHETGATMDPSIRQKSNVYNEKKEVIGSKEGPGRGLYQYELETLGGSGAGRVAMNRLYAALGGDLIEGKKPENMPKWMNQYFSINQWGHHEVSGDVDFSELTEEQQKILFLADKLIASDGKAIKDIGILADDEWWAKHHHKGDNSNMQKFRADKDRYLKNRK